MCVCDVIYTSFIKPNTIHVMISGLEHIVFFYNAFIRHYCNADFSLRVTNNTNLHCTTPSIWYVLFKKICFAMATLWVVYFTWLRVASRMFHSHLGNPMIAKVPAKQTCSIQVKSAINNSPENIPQNACWNALYMYAVVNSLRTGGANMRRWTASSSICFRLFGAKPLPDPMLTYCRLTLRNKILIEIE